MLLISWLIQCLLVLLTVAFFTLFERKVIGLFHNRLGPNNVSLFGVLQPLLDAFKLLTNQSLVPLRSNKLMYNVSPHIGLVLGLVVWSFLPFLVCVFSFNYSVLLFFCLGSSLVFSVLVSGWSSNSNYSLIGCLRSVAQSISYEAVFSTLLCLTLLLIFSFSINSFLTLSSVAFLFLFPIWFICTLAETHRAPFDFSESESELVSGFNTEYSGCYFAFIFLSEYSMLLFSCALISFVFLGSVLSNSYFLVVLSSLFISFVFIWVRITFCRFRYDLLMIACWKSLLPSTILIFISFCFLIVFCVFS